MSLEPPRSRPRPRPTPAPRARHHRPDGEPDPAPLRSPAPRPTRSGSRHAAPDTEVTRTVVLRASPGRTARRVHDEALTEQALTEPVDGRAIARLVGGPDATVVIPRYRVDPADAPTAPLPTVAPRQVPPPAGAGLPTVPIPGQHRRSRIAPSPATRRETVRFTLVTTVLPTLALIIGALGVRAGGLMTSFELWVDEMVYAELGASVARGELPNLPDGPFFLHPPGFFLVEGLVIRVLGITGTSMDLVYELRWIGAVAGAVSVGLLYLALRRPAGAPAALLASGVMLFEPFVLRNNSRVFLETTAMLPVLVGMVIVLRVLGRTAPDRSWRGIGALVVAGLAMGYGIFSKDVLVVCTVVPVVAAVFWRRTMVRRDAAVLVVAMAVPYTAYLSLLVVLGRFGDWVTAKSDGVQRMLGFVQTTGFNAPNAPSLVSRVLDQLGHFGTSYVLLLACPVVGVLVCLSRLPERRFVGLVAVMVGMFGIYTAAFGTFEEQYGYPVMIAGIAAVAVYGAELHERRPGLRKATGVVGGLFLMATAALGLRAELTPDDGFLQVRAWVQANLPQDARVGVTNSTGEMAFADDPRFGVWASLRALDQNGATYVVTQSLPTGLGYGYARPELVTWLVAHAVPVFSSAGPTNGTTTVWHIDQNALDAGAAAGVASPALNPER